MFINSYLYVIDRIHFWICNLFPFSKKYYSHKFEGPVLTYEITLGICSRDIVWAHGGYLEGKYPDYKMACTAFVYILDRELNNHVIADAKYCHLPFFISPKKNNYLEGDLYARHVLARHENVNTRVQRFKILHDCYIGNLKFYPTIFQAIVNVCQVEIDNMHKLPDVHGLDE